MCRSAYRAPSRAAGIRGAGSGRRARFASRPWAEEAYGTTALRLERTAGERGAAPVTGRRDTVTAGRGRGAHILRRKSRGGPDGRHMRHGQSAPLRSARPPHTLPIDKNPRIAPLEPSRSVKVEVGRGCVRAGAKVGKFVQTRGAGARTRVDFGACSVFFVFFCVYN